MPAPYISFRTFLILLCLPIVILKDIQWRCNRSLLLIKVSFQWVIFTVIPLLGVYALIGILSIPTAVFLGAIRLSTYIAQILATLVEQYSEWQNKRIPHQDQNEPNNQIQSSPPSRSRSGSTSSTSSSSGVCTPTTPIDLDLIEQWQLDVSHWPSPETELELEDELEYLKEPTEVVLGYLPLILDLDVPSLNTEELTVQSDTTDTVTCRVQPSPKSDPDPTESESDSHPPTVVQEQKRTPTDEEIDALLMKAKALNIKHALLIERSKIQMKRKNQKFEATFHGDLPRGGKRVSKLGGLGVILE